MNNPQYSLRNWGGGNKIKQLPRSGLNVVYHAAVEQFQGFVFYLTFFRRFIRRLLVSPIFDSY